MHQQYGFPTRLGASRWGLKDSQNHNQSPDYREPPEKMAALEGGFFGSALCLSASPLLKPCPSQALPPNLSELPNMELETLPLPKNVAKHIENL